MSNDEKNWKKPQRYLGPSQLASCLGLSQFLSPEELKDRIENGYHRTTNAYIQCGINSEDNARQLYSSYTGFSVQRAPWKSLFYNPRLGGQADGLIYEITRNGENGNGRLVRGVEIKCHLNRDKPLLSIPDYYLVQIVAYMQIYMVDTWDLMSCCVNDQGKIYKYKIITVRWNDVKHLWSEQWYPKISSFINSISWKFPIF